MDVKQLYEEDLLRDKVIVAILMHFMGPIELHLLHRFTEAKGVVTCRP